MRLKTFRLTSVLILGLVGLLSAALSAEVQPGEKVPRIGYLNYRAGPNAADEAFRRTLRDLGWIEGQNIVIEYRWAAGKRDR